MKASSGKRGKRIWGKGIAGRGMSRQGFGGKGIWGKGMGRQGLGGKRIWRQGNKQAGFLGQANLGQGNVRHENPVRYAGIDACPSAAPPTEIVYHQIPLPRIRLPHSPVPPVPLPAIRLPYSSPAVGGVGIGRTFVKLERMGRTFGK